MYLWDPVTLKEIQVAKKIDEWMDINVVVGFQKTFTRREGNKV